MTLYFGKHEKKNIFRFERKKSQIRANTAMSRLNIQSKYIKMKPGTIPYNFSLHKH